MPTRRAYVYLLWHCLKAINPGVVAVRVAEKPHILHNRKQSIASVIKVQRERDRPVFLDVMAMLTGPYNLGWTQTKELQLVMQEEESCARNAGRPQPHRTRNPRHHQVFSLAHDACLAIAVRQCLHSKCKLQLAPC